VTMCNWNFLVIIIKAKLQDQIILRDFPQIAIFVASGIITSAGAACLTCLDAANVACASDGKYLKCLYGRPLLNLLHSCPNGQVCANIPGVCAPIGTVEPECSVCSDEDMTDERLCPRSKRDLNSLRGSQELLRDLNSFKCGVTGDEFCKQVKRVGVFKHPCKKFCRK
jgi:Carbohydrate binding domain (family 19)